MVGPIVFGSRDVGTAIPMSPPADVDLEGLTRPLLEALAGIAGLESTYLMR